MRPGGLVAATIAIALLQAGAVAQTGEPNGARATVALRVASFAAGAPRLAVEIDGEILVADVAVGTVTGYRTVPAGEVTVSIRESVPDGAGAGQGDDAARGPAVAEPASYAMDAGGYYTLVVTNLNPQDDAGESRDGVVAAQLVEDPLVDFPPAGHALVRVANALADVPRLTAVAVPVGAPTTEAAPDAADAGAEPPAGAVALAADAASGAPGTYAAVPAGVYRVRFRAAEGGDAIYELAELVVHAGGIYTLYVYGQRDGGRPELTLALDALLRTTIDEAERWPGSVP